MNWHEFTAVQLRAILEAGEASALDVAEACLAQVEARDSEIEAWAYLDPDHVRAQASACDALRQSGRPLGPLHGIPVAIKDIVDTQGMPTENGTVLDKGRRPRNDAVLVSRLKSAGAVIMGKTVTTELAYFNPGKTKNPHDAGRTPGGSSSGSAAAVASFMAPLAVGSQTTGSVVRPAAFCGTVGFKPSFGTIPRTGVLAQATPLDTMGTFARSVEDAALLADCMAGRDAGDPDSRDSAWTGFAPTAASEPPLAPTFAFVKQPAWGQAEESTKEAFGELADALGDRVEEVELPSSFARGLDLHRTLMTVGIAKNFGAYYNRGKDQLSQRLCEAVEEGRGVLAHDYLLALDWIALLNAGLEEIFERFDAIITPAAPGEAPTPETTGNPAFCALWTFCGTPALSLPLLAGPNGLPLGVQLVGARGDDARLLRSANWLINHLREEG